MIFWVFLFCFNIGVFVFLRRSHMVDLHRKTCTCQRWRVYGFPCSHAIAAIAKNGEHFFNYIDYYFSVECYRELYSIAISPIPNYDRYTTFVQFLFLLISSFLTVQNQNTLLFLSIYTLIFCFLATGPMSTLRMKLFIHLSSGPHQEDPRKTASKVHGKKARTPSHAQIVARRITTTRPLASSSASTKQQMNRLTSKFGVHFYFF